MGERVKIVSVRGLKVCQGWIEFLYNYGKGNKKSNRFEYNYRTP